MLKYLDDLTPLDGQEPELCKIFRIEAQDYRICTGRHDATRARSFPLQSVFGSKSIAHVSFWTCFGLRPIFAALRVHHVITVIH